MCGSLLGSQPRVSDFSWVFANTKGCSGRCEAKVSCLLVLFDMGVAELVQAFQKANSNHKPAFIAYTTAGYPSPKDTVSILLGLQEGFTLFPSLTNRHYSPPLPGLLLTATVPSRLSLTATIFSVFCLV